MPASEDDNDLINQTDFSWDSTITGPIPPHLILLAEMGNRISAIDYQAVSYTHLTLPTILLV